MDVRGPGVHRAVRGVLELAGAGAAVRPAEDGALHAQNGLIPGEPKRSIRIKSKSG